MMLLEKIRARYEETPARQSTGNPTGSQWGRCAARLQMLRYPNLSHPERLPMRARMVMEMGNLVEDWWRAHVAAVYPDKLGLAQEPFYIPVPFDRADVVTLDRMIQQRQLWGVVRLGFERPYVRRDPATGRIKLRLLGGGRDQGHRSLGFVLDPDAETLYAPTFIDNVWDDDDLGLCVLEAKAVSNFGFRRALLGQFDREKRQQLAGTAAALDLPVTWLLYRKETAHLLQISYNRSDTALAMTQVRYLTSNGVQRVEYINGHPVEGVTPGDAEWELAQAWTPYQPGILEEIQEHIRRVLLYDPASGAPWYREYGPDFTCRKCMGLSYVQCGKCGTSGKTPTGKVHKLCGGHGQRPCTRCASTGRLDTTELGYPCTYCPVVHFCYPMATLTLDRKPHYTVTRADWNAAKLAVFPVEPAPVEEEDETAPVLVTPGGRAEETEEEPE